MGAQIRPIISDQDGMDINHAIQHWPSARMVFTAPSHQFPLGGTLSLARRHTLLAWAAAQQAWIFEDDYNSEFRYKGRPIQALQGLDQQQRVIYAGTFSKMMFPDLRIGFLVVPPALIEAFTLAKYYADTRTAYLEQAALAMFIAEGHYARHVRRVRKACSERQQALIQAIETHLPSQFNVQSSASGIHLIAGLKSQQHEHQWIENCRVAALGVQPLSRYFAAEATQHALLFGFAAHRPKVIDLAIQQLATTLTNLYSADG